MSIGNNKYYLFWRFVEGLDIYLNTDGFAWILGTERNIVLLNNEPGKYETWAMTDHNTRYF